MAIDIYTRGCYVESRSLCFQIDLLYADDSQIHEYALNKYKRT